MGICEKGYMVEFIVYFLDVMDSKVVVSLIWQIDVKIVINVGLVFVNMMVLQGCIDIGVVYLDIVIYEDFVKVCEILLWYGNYEWKCCEVCEKVGIIVILGVGFDLGVVNVYVCLVEDEYFDKVDLIDIVDINVGLYGCWFVMNFDFEINFCEFIGIVYSWQKGVWQENKMFEVGCEWDLFVVGKQIVYLFGYDEVYSLFVCYKDVDVWFWMGFGVYYINVFIVLQNFGLLLEKFVIIVEGFEVVLLKLVKVVLFDFFSFVVDYEGKICIGDLVKGMQDGKFGEVFIYNVVDYKDVFNEVGSQGISYIVGVLLVVVVIFVVCGIWDVKKMVNVEDLFVCFFFELLGDLGLLICVIDVMGDYLL